MELANSMKSGVIKNHHNQETNDFITLFSEIINNYAIKQKLVYTTIIFQSQANRH